MRVSKSVKQKGGEVTVVVECARAIPWDPDLWTHGKFALRTRLQRSPVSYSVRTTRRFEFPR